jgi:hypothetical protein
MGGTIAKIMAGTVSRVNTKIIKAKVTKLKAKMGKDGRRNQDTHRRNSRTAKGRLRGGSSTRSPSSINKGGKTSSPGLVATINHSNSNNNRTSRTSRTNRSGRSGNNIATLDLVLLLVRSSNNNIAIPDLVLLLVSSSNSHSNSNSNSRKPRCIREKKMRWTCMMPRNPLLPL